MSEKINVLFVCLGNICRSPMAEAVFAHIVKDKGLEYQFRIDSAGTASYHVGEASDYRSIETCRRHDVVINHYARQVVPQDFSEFDYMLCMDKSNLADLQNMQPKGSKAIVKLFGEYDPKGERTIRDPYYGGIDGFEKNFQQVTRCSEAFIESLNLK